MGECKPHKQPMESPILQAHVTTAAWKTQVLCHHCRGAQAMFSHNNWSTSQHRGPILRALRVQVFKLLLSAQTHQLFKATVNQCCVQTANLERFPRPCFGDPEQTHTSTQIAPKLCRGPRPTPSKAHPSPVQARPLPLTSDCWSCCYDCLWEMKGRSLVKQRDWKHQMTFKR